MRFLLEKLHGFHQRKRSPEEETRLGVVNAGFSESRAKSDVTVLNGLAHTRKRRRWLYNGSFLIAYIGLVILAWFALDGGGGPFALLGLPFLVVYETHKKGWQQATIQRRRATQQLIAQGKKAAPGALIEALCLETNSLSIRRQARDLLLVQWQRWPAKSLSLLSSPERAALEEMVTGSYYVAEADTEFVIAFLQALPHSESDVSLTCVRILAEGRGKGRHTQNAEVRAAATDCLAVLQIYRARSEASALLLRVVVDPGEANASLLRPTKEKEQSAPYLLRAVPSSPPREEPSGD